MQAIIKRIAAAPFNAELIVVPVEDRGKIYLTYELERLTLSLTVQLVRRVVIDHQWADGVTADQYLADLRATIRPREARLGLYGRRGGAMAVVLARTADVVPSKRQGVEPLPIIAVVYAADRGIIVSGYQAKDESTLAIPENVIWLT